MRRPPRPPGTPILDAALVWRIVLVSVLLLAGSFGLFLRELAQGSSLAEARTVAVNVFVVVQAMYLFNCRSLTLSALRVGLFSNPAIWYGVLIMALLQALVDLPAADESPVRHGADRLVGMAGDLRRRRARLPRRRPREAAPAPSGDHPA
jgi:magnesium-transporting ATPase (P-type)